MQLEPVALKRFAEFACETHAQSLVSTAKTLLTCVHTLFNILQQLQEHHLKDLYFHHLKGSY